VSARAVAAAALWLLAAWVLLWHLWLAPPANASPPLVGLLAVSPLLPVLALWLTRPRPGLIWGALIGLGYFAHGVTELLTAPRLRVPASIEALLVLVLIGALWLATRAEQRARNKG
jgi:uncharacterized membrane protein